jgi:hypothetical protein
MNIEITENIIRGSIVYALKNAFGDSYKYYDEGIPEGFEKPSFGVSRVDNTSRKGYTGHEYKIADDTYRYVIKYFTNEKYSKVKDINEKIDVLKKTFRYLDIVNIVGDKVYSKPNRINDITIEESDGTLLFQISFPIRTVEYLNLDKVKTNTLVTHIINKEKEEE